MKKDHNISEEYVSVHIRRGDKHIEACKLGEASSTRFKTV